MRKTIPLLGKKIGEGMNVKKSIWNRLIWFSHRCYSVIFSVELYTSSRTN